MNFNFLQVLNGWLMIVKGKDLLYLGLPFKAVHLQKNRYLRVTQLIKTFLGRNIQSILINIIVKIMNLLGWKTPAQIINSLARRIIQKHP